MATYKEIGDGIIIKVKAVSGFNARTVAPFSGSVLAYYNEHTTNTPFVLVKFAGAEYEGEVVDNTIAYERAKFDLTVVAQDLRGQGYSMDDNSALLELIRDALQGVTLTGYIAAVPAHGTDPVIPEVPASYPTLTGLEPLKLDSIEPDADLTELGLTAYVFRVSTAQVRQ